MCVCNESFPRAGTSPAVRSVSLMQELCFRVLTEPCDGMHSAPLCCQLARVLQLKRHVRLVFGLTEAALRPCSRPHESFLFLFLAAFRSDGRQRRLLSVYFFLCPSESRLCARLCLYQIVLLLFFSHRQRKRDISSISFQTQNLFYSFCIKSKN